MHYYYFTVNRNFAFTLQLEFQPIGELKRNKEIIKSRDTNKRIKLLLDDDSDDEYTCIVRKRKKS